MSSPIMKGTKRRLMSAGAHCAYCDVLLTKAQGPGRKRPTDASWDHVVPIACGGDNSPENLVLACVACNEAKGEASPTMFLIGCLVAARMEAR